MPSPEEGPNAGPWVLPRTARRQVPAFSFPPEQMPPGRRSQLRPLTRRTKEGPKLLSEIIIQESSTVDVGKFERISQGARDPDPDGGQTQARSRSREL